jgi:hydroxymethylpyrimidine/phosphomethylpyrimidine kinase
MGSSFFDGSVIWDLDIFSAVNKCLETHADADIVVDVVMTSRKTLKVVDASNFNAL